ncbi:calcium-binding protein 2-like [Paramormyrops kingsleyae]|uniref:calcium-binding protein 2-like n=1 Tax=Paramormyrops kingsleyae TaxID=1676925 RepID=UPI003B973D7C
MEELREGFKEFEYKNKGIVKCESLGECMRTMGYMPTEMRLIELSETLRSGKVDFEDFSDLMGPKVVEDTTHMIGIREMKEAFQEIDADGDGQISAAELKEAMKSLLGEQLSPAELEEILQDADLNGDGQIDFEGEAFAPRVLRWAGVPFGVSPALGYLGEAPGPRDPLLD